MSREQQVRDALGRYLAAVRQATDTQLEVLSRELIGVVRADGPPVDDGPARLVAAIRRIDDAATLRSVLDELDLGVARLAARSTLLLVERAVATVYRQHEFPSDRVPAGLAAGEAAAVARAIATQAVAIARPGDDPKAPPLLQVPAGQVAVLVPIVVAEQVVAMVHAEGEDTAAPVEASVPGWASLVEALARHASAKLENVTSKRTAEVLARG